jgi:hypothetical protein
MGFQSKISNKSRLRSDYQSLLEGVGSITIDQRMRYSKRAVKSGSLDGDWKLVGKDIAKAISSLKKDYAAD